MKSYDYVFYKYYKLAKLITNSANPELNVILWTTVLQGLNIMFIIYVVNRFIFSLPKWLSNPSDIQIIIGAIFIYLENTFLYTIGDKPKRIEKKYSSETVKEKRVGNYLVFTYTFLSILVMFIVTIMNRK